MASYGYGPPPPPPPPAPSRYGQQYQTTYSGQDHPRRGRGGGFYSGGRGGGGGSGDRPAASGYAYTSQGSYGNGAAPPPQGVYAPPPPPPRQSQGQQQWTPAHDPAANGHRTVHPPHPAQGYPGYAPQMYQQQLPPSQSHSPPQHYHPSPNAATAAYGQQPSYGASPAPAAQQSYGHQYSHARPGQQSHGSPGQTWAPPPGGRGSHGGAHYGSRGGRGSGGYKTQMMGPPIRLGFENGNPHDGQGLAAPVSSGYPPQPHVPYGGVAPPPPPGPAGYAAPASYQAYPPPGPPQYYDPYYTQNNRSYTGSGRGGNQGGPFRGGRPHFGGDKMRHHNKKQGGPSPHGTNDAPSGQHQKSDASPAGKKKKRKTNTLGLTPGEESDEDEMDEEAKLVEMIGPDAPNPVDIASWIAERRKNFPTQARRQAKLTESGSTGEVGEAENASVGGNNGDGGGGGGGKSSSAGLTALERQQMKAEKLRRQLEKVESSIKRKREQQDEGDEMRNPEGGGAGNGESDDDVSSVDPKSDDDDAPPESLPIRTDATKGKKTFSSEAPTGTTTAEAAAAAAKSNVIPPAAKKADQSKHCKYYSTGGTCAKKGRCRFVHDQAVREAALLERERNGGRMTLQQRLILNDKDQEDLTIVKTLQYLKEKGIMREPAVVAAPAPVAPVAPVAPAAPVAKSEDSPSGPSPQQTNTDAVVSEEEQPTHSKNGSLANGVANGSAATPNGAPRVRYEGWDLSGFGNKVSKSDAP